MGVIKRVVKPRTRKGKKALENRLPKTLENTKKTILLYGQNTSEITRKCFRDLFALKKNFALHLHRKNSFRPFEDVLPIERLSEKHDASLFAFINHTKKRPHNLTIGRMYDFHLLDMIELGIENYKSMSDIPGQKVSEGTKCCLVFCGTEFEEDERYLRLKNLLIDFFRGVEATCVQLQGFEHALFFLMKDGKLYFRSYKILLKKSGTRKPRVELVEIGPSSSMIVRRTELASKDLFKAACKQPEVVLKPKMRKNTSKTPLGSKVAKVHMKKQDLGQLQTRKLRALKKGKKGKKGEKRTYK